MKIRTPMPEQVVLHRELYVIGGLVRIIGGSVGLGVIVSPGLFKQFMRK
jgi:hypothetical protein